ncbi:STAS domain-containing protein [Streptomyces sp. NPDC059134]|uniref:STAS domain-containing protein n=1 Tax=Streptomyces sp. NPDC059134 TaxID=3346738 RepID=UPI0036BACDC6
MTATPPDPLAVVVTTPAADTVVVRLDGEMDYETSYEVIDTVRQLLRSHRGVARLELHCGGLTMCDSMGLSALLVIRRLAESDGVRLVLTERRPSLERVLRLTGTRGRLDGAEGDGRGHGHEERGREGDGREENGREEDGREGRGPTGGSGPGAGPGTGPGVGPC